MKCPKCGKHNVEGVAACVWCGAAFAQDKGESGSGVPIGRILAALLVAAVLWAIVSWFLDAPAIKNDYTVADLRSAAPEYNESYEILISLAEEDPYRDDAPVIGLTAEDVNTLDVVDEAGKSRDQAAIAEAVSQNAAAIRKAWEDGRKGREVIARLAEFPEIADLSEPRSFMYKEESEIHLCHVNIKYLSSLYRAYVLLEVESGSEAASVTELIQFDSLLRKLNNNARSLITKLVCIALLGRDMETANFIANRPQTSEATVRLLAEHFQPLTDTDASLRNGFMFEYMAFSQTLNLSTGKVPGLTKRNSALRLYRNFCDKWIAMSEGIDPDKAKQLNVWPAIGPRWIRVELDAQYKLPLVYMCYNPMGWMLVRIWAPALEKVLYLQMRLRIRDDMLRIVLNKRLGKEASLKARAYGDEYIIDTEGKRILSPGPDGEVGTKDDIMMPIDPNVLRL